MNAIATLAVALPVLLFAAPQDPVKAAASNAPTAATAKQDPVLGRRTPTGFVIPPGVHQIEKLIEDAGRFLTVNILLDPSVAAVGNLAPITITKQLELDYNGCLDVLSGILHSRQLYMMPMNREQGLYEVVQMQGQRRAEIVMSAAHVAPKRIDSYANRYELILTTVRLEHINAQMANNALRPFFAHGGGGQSGLNIGNMGDSQHLVLQGFGPQVARAYALLRAADIPNEQETHLEQRVSSLQTQVLSLRDAVTKLTERLDAR